MAFFVQARSSKLKILSRKICASGDIDGIPLDLKNHFYIRNWAVSSYERWGLNCNADGFRHVVLSKDFNTFDGAWVCLNHVAETSDDSIGQVIRPVYTDEQYVENIMAVNRKEAEAKGFPFLEKDIVNNVITDTSMGAVARATECTICKNIAVTDKDYCEHLKKDSNGRSMKGSAIMVNGKKRVVGELYVDAIFIEDSILTDEEGADINAKIFNIAAKKNNGVPCGDTLFYAIKASIKEHGRTKRLVRLMNSFEKNTD